MVRALMHVIPVRGFGLPWVGGSVGRGNRGFAFTVVWSSQHQHKHEGVVKVLAIREIHTFHPCEQRDPGEF